MTKPNQPQLDPRPATLDVDATADNREIALTMKTNPRKTGPPRRKCNRCGKYGHPNDMVHCGYGRVMYSEAHFAHKACLEAEKTPNDKAEARDSAERKQCP